MPEGPWPGGVELSAYLAHLDTVPLKVLMPAPILVVLADLLESARTTGPRLGYVSGGEIVGSALLAALPLLSTQAQAVGDYRETRAHQVLTRATSTSGLFNLPARDDLGLK
jgi:uncharacterized membrane protein